MSLFTRKNQVKIPEDTDTVRTATLSDYKKVVKALQKAFKHDPFCNYLSSGDGNSPEEIKELDRMIWEVMVYAHILKGIVHIIGDYEGIAIWLAPGQDTDDWITLLRSGLYTLKYKMKKEARERFFDEFVPMLHDSKEEIMGERDNNCWYLVYLGTVPKGRGKGYSRKLMDHVTRVADEQNLPCYLESSNPINVPIYEHFGYQVIKRITLGAHTSKPVPLDLMVREPRQFEISEAETLVNDSSVEDQILSEAGYKNKKVVHTGNEKKSRC